MPHTIAVHKTHRLLGIIAELMFKDISWYFCFSIRKTINVYKYN